MGAGMNTASINAALVEVVEAVVAAAWEPAKSSYSTVEVQKAQKYMNPESMEANRSIAHRKGSDCALILSNLKMKQGTCDELERRVGLSHQTCSARLRDLFLEGAIVRTGTRRPTESGRMAAVWKIAPKPLEPCICA
jgi:hypothetical protein